MQLKVGDRLADETGEWEVTVRSPQAARTSVLVSGGWINLPPRRVLSTYVGCDGLRGGRVGAVGGMVQRGSRRLMGCFGQRRIAMGVQPSKRIGICPRGQEGRRHLRTDAESLRGL